MQKGDHIIVQKGNKNTDHFTDRHLKKNRKILNEINQTSQKRVIDSDSNVSAREYQENKKYDLILKTKPRTSGCVNRSLLKNEKHDYNYKNGQTNNSFSSVLKGKWQTSLNDSGLGSDESILFSEKSEIRPSFGANNKLGRLNINSQEKSIHKLRLEIKKLQVCIYYYLTK